MQKPSRTAVDGNEAVASVAYRTNEVIAIYPITPASPIGELADSWAAKRLPNLWGDVPLITEMQSEGGAAGAVHGALQTGALTTTFTASQGLLLMLPNLYKIAGELTAFCMHVAARTVATHALSIFCDHSDVMAVRQAGLAMLVSSSVQEAHDFALVGQAATLASRVPFLHFFDGFRTSHEIADIELLGDSELRSLMDEGLVEAHRGRALSPDRPSVRGTAQNPDAFFQAREAANPFYDRCAGVVEATLDRLAEVSGRRYGLFDYVGHPEAERVVVVMGSAAETAHETVSWLVEQGERVGLVKVRLFRPFVGDALLGCLPASARRLAVLDRTKEPGAVGEPLYLDVASTLALEQSRIEVVGGRYGLSSKEFTPRAVKAVFDHLLDDRPAHGFTVGIHDDVSHRSLVLDPEVRIPTDRQLEAVFFGLGSDGTVGANKSSIKILAEETDSHVQGYFVYDSKKAGATTVSHLRVATEPIRSAYLIDRASFVACHQQELLERLDVFGCAAPGAIALLNSRESPATVWDTLPLEAQEQIVERGLELWVIDAHRLAREAGLGGRINTVMQVCFFALTGILPRELALRKIKEGVEKTYARRGPEVVRQNLQAVESALPGLHRVETPPTVTTRRRRPAPVPENAPDFVKRVTGLLLAGRGDALPVSAFPVDGAWPTGTSRFEKRRIASEIPIWDPAICIQCNQCALVCPHAAIRSKVAPETSFAAAPSSFRTVPYAAPDLRGLVYSLQVAPEDCTGCHLCVEICPAKDKANPRHKAIDMKPIAPHLASERENFDFFLGVDEIDPDRLPRLDAKGSQFLEPLFEFSGACAGCGETPYIKLLTQLFGDHLLIANATGCSSIFGGNLPTTPYTTNAAGRGPAWSNSLFEDNAEFGFGFRLAVDSHRDQALRVLEQMRGEIGEGLVAEVLQAAREHDPDLSRQRRAVEELRRRLTTIGSREARRLDSLADWLVEKTVWLVGGDGWAYDIGYGGLDHVLAAGRNVNVLVLDTEVYSNTGGQQSKATPLGAAAKFAAAGKEVPKKDLGLEAMSYGNVYVARIALGAKMNQTVLALREAASYPGTSLVLAYSHCIAHGYDLSRGLVQQRRAVECGVWPLYRFDPRRLDAGEPPLQLDSRPPAGGVGEYMRAESRFRVVEQQDRERFRYFIRRTEADVRRRWSLYEQLAGITIPVPAVDREPP